MQVREATDNVKTLGESLAVLISAVSGIDAKQLDSFIKQRDTLQVAILDAKDKLAVASAQLQEKLAYNDSTFKADREQKQKAIDELDALLDGRRKDLRTAEEQHRQKLAEETAAQTQTRRVQLDRLDNAIKVKTKQLEELTKQLDQTKERVANI